MDAPLVSVISPAYNCAATIGRTLQSVLDQSYTNTEIVVVDDKSRDNTAEVIAQFSDPRILYLKQDHAERSVARNTGISNSHGEYLAFVDSDDWWGVSKLEKQIALLEANRSLGMIYSDLYYVDAESDVILWQYGNKVKLMRGRVWKNLCETNFIQSPTPVVPRWVFDQTGLFDPDMPPLEDWDMWLRIAASFPVDFIPEPLAFYRYGINTTSLGKPSNRLYQSHLKLLDKIENQTNSDVTTELNKLNKHRSMVYYTYGVQLLHRQQYHRAEHLFQEASRLNRMHSLTYARLIQVSILASKQRRHGD